MNWKPLSPVPSVVPSVFLCRKNKDNEMAVLVLFSPASDYGPASFMVMDTGWYESLAELVERTGADEWTELPE